MPTVAPRYNPEGVRVGGMPVPDVKPLTGTAKALESVGDTLGDVGKLINYAQEKENARKRADETAGADLAMEWKSRNEKRNADFQTGNVGQQVYDGYEQFSTTMEGDDGSDLTKDLSQGAKAEFDRRVQIYRRSIQASADQHAAQQHRVYTTDVAKKEYGVASSGSALALASGQDEQYQIQLGQAIAADKRLSEVTGKKHNPQEVLESVRHMALRAAISESPHQGVKVYNKLKGGFGALEDNAARDVAAAQDEVWSMDTSSALVSMYRDENGLTDWAAVESMLVTTEGADPKRIATTQQRLNAMKEREDAWRTEQGKNAAAMATEALNGSYSRWEKVISSDEFRRMVSVAMPQQVNSIRALVENTSSETDKIFLDYALTVGNREQQDQAIRMFKTGFMGGQDERGPVQGLRLSAADRLKYAQMAKKMIEDRGDTFERKVADRLREQWKKDQKPLPRQDYTGALGKQDAALAADFQRQVMEIVTEFNASGSLDPKSDTDINRVIYENQVLVTRPVGKLTGGDVETVRARSLYDPSKPMTPSQMQVYGITKSDSYAARGAKMASFERQRALEDAKIADALENPTSAREYRNTLVSIGITSMSAREAAPYWQRLSELEAQEREAAKQAEWQSWGNFSATMRDVDALKQRRLQKAYERLGQASRPAP